MKIWLKKDIYGDFDAVDVPENTTAEHIFFRYRDQLPYTPMAAKINNIFYLANYFVFLRTLIDGDSQF